MSKRLAALTATKVGSSLVLGVATAASVHQSIVALGRVVFTSREHVIALEPREKGLLGITLRYPYEVRKQSEYFDDIADEKIPKDMLELAQHIVKSKASHFHPEKFEDQYEDALKELLQKKQAGEKIEAPREPTPAKVVNLMDALRASVQAEHGGGGGGQRRTRSERRASASHRAPKKAALSSARSKGCESALQRPFGQVHAVYGTRAVLDAFTRR
jgi:DNA end-binding protein Ku